MANIGAQREHTIETRRATKACYMTEVPSVGGVLLRVSRYWVFGMLVVAACGSRDGTRGDASDRDVRNAGSGGTAAVRAREWVSWLVNQPRCAVG